MERLSDLSTDELASGICLRAGRIAAAEAELLPWIAEFDRREGWAGTGLLSCAHWLSWRVGLSLGTAREQVRVARRLEDLPELAAAFGAGRISYSKARAITRVAEPDDGVDWVSCARHSSAAQLEKVVRGVRRARANQAAEQDPEAAAWSLRTRARYDDNGNFTLTISGPAQFLPVVQAGIEAKKAELQRQREAAAEDVAAERAHVSAEAPEVGEDAGAEVAPADAEVAGLPARDAGSTAQADGWPGGTTQADVLAAVGSFFTAQQRRAEEEGVVDVPADPAAAAAVRAPASPPSAGAADVSAEACEPATVTDAEALLALAQDALATEQAAHPGIARRRRSQLTAQVDPVSGWGRQADGELLPPTSLRAVMTTLPGRGGVLRLRPVTVDDLRRHDLGRTQREVSQALRELVGALDGERCRFPGCTRHKRLHAHHVVYWSHGGATDLGNLVLVCSRHHTLIHAQGFSLVLHPDRSLEVATAEGVPLLHHPAPAWGDAAALAQGPGQHVSAEALPPDHCDARLDLGYVVSVLMAQAS